jgi:hypothetical protein
MAHRHATLRRHEADVALLDRTHPQTRFTSAPDGLPHCRRCLNALRHHSGLAKDGVCELSLFGEQHGG